MPITVLAHGCFDVLHYAHLIHLQKAKALGDRLVVSVTGNDYVKKGPGRPLFDEKHRMNMIAALRFVDAVTICDADDSVGVILRIRPQIYTKGGDYRQADPIGNLEKERKAVESIGGRLVIIDNEITYSSTELMTGELLRKRIVQCQTTSS